MDFKTISNKLAKIESVKFADIRCGTKLYQGTEAPYCDVVIEVPMSIPIALLNKISIVIREAYKVERPYVDVMPYHKRITIKMLLVEKPEKQEESHE